MVHGERAHSVSSRGKKGLESVKGRFLSVQKSGKACILRRGPADPLAHNRKKGAVKFTGGGVLRSVGRSRGGDEGFSRCKFGRD